MKTNRHKLSKEEKLKQIIRNVHSLGPAYFDYKHYAYPERDSRPAKRKSSPEKSQ